MTNDFRTGLYPGSDGNVYAGRLPALVTYTLECSKCKAETSIMYRLNPGGCLMWPTIPEGWQWVGDLLICPKHTVRVEDAEPPKYTPPCRHCKGHAVADPDSGLCEACLKLVTLDLRRRIVWTCPHCPYQWQGEIAPEECPSCGSTCAFGRKEKLNAKP